jgi:phage anti-repressor protein
MKSNGRSISERISDMAVDNEQLFFEDGVHAADLHAALGAQMALKEWMEHQIFTFELSHKWDYWIERCEDVDGTCVALSYHLKLDVAQAIVSSLTNEYQRQRALKVLEKYQSERCPIDDFYFHNHCQSA